MDQQPTHYLNIYRIIRYLYPKHYEFRLNFSFLCSLALLKPLTIAHYSSSFRGARKQIKQKILTEIYNALGILLLMMLTPLLANATEDERFRLIPDHQSEYNVKKFGSVVGQVKNTLRYQKNVINYASTANAKGIASFFIKNDHEETSVLYWPKNAKQPLQQSYNYFGGKKYKKNQQILFKYIEPEKTDIEGSYKNKSYTFSTDKTVWARQLLPLLISNTLQTKPETKLVSFFITNKGSLHKYTYTFEVKETLNFKNKRLSVLKFKVHKKNSRRLSYVWLSKDYYYLPLKVEQYKDGELNASMFMTQFKLKKQ